MHAKTAKLAMYGRFQDFLCGPKAKDTSFGAVALFKTLNQGKKGRAFLSFGVAAHYNRSIYEDEHGQVHISNGDEESYGLIFGPGVGLERWFAENFAVSLEIPAAIRVDSDEGFSILSIPNCALAYRW